MAESQVNCKDIWIDLLCFFASIQIYHLPMTIDIFSDFHLQFNFVGRILGPRGMTTKQLEQETGCKIMVRGKGSMRDKKKVSNLYLSAELK